jgi:LytS/YehU family sensor histidine kinase
MSRRVTLLVHLALWAIVVLSPLSFMHGSGFSWLQYLMTCVSPLLMMVVFYVNYLWLAPRYFVVGRHRYYGIVNIVMVVSLGIFLHYWMSLVHDHFEPDHIRERSFTTINIVFFILRDIFNLAVAAIVATGVVLALRWQHSEEARLSAEAARAEAELRNLRSQINPHFLLNTLNNIYALTAIDPPRAQDAIQQLSKMLRHMLYDNQEQYVRLSDEIQFLENYISLMKIRLSSNVDVKVEVDIPKKPILVAPLIAVSLIENAFKHGVSPTEPSFIHIAIRATTEQVVCDIENSNHPKTEKDHSGHGIGLQQVQHRLDLSYPGHYTWNHGISNDGKSYRSVICIDLGS